MVLITGDPGEGLKVQSNGVSGRAKAEAQIVKPVLDAVLDAVLEAVLDTPAMSLTVAEGDKGEELQDDQQDGVEPDYSRNYWEDDDDIYQVFEELDFDSLPDRSDTCSIFSDDSFYPPDGSLACRLFCSPGHSSPEPMSFFTACCNNNPIIVKVMIRQGVTEEEVAETDKNRRSGLIVACYQGYVDVVIALSQCPYIDVNWQDNEGNTALITAVQAGHIMISNYLLNYFPGLDIEMRNCHGFTAMMKAAMQGQSDCVRALMLAGGNVEARDYGRKMTPREWALYTGRYETANLMERLMAQPCAEQFCFSFSLEWPKLQELLEEARAPKSCWRRLTNPSSCCPFTFYISNKVKPLDNGVLDHMVRVTTGLRSPAIATACQTVCPGSPPRVGKRRHAVQDILRRQRVAALQRPAADRLHDYAAFFQSSRILLVPRKTERRASLQPARRLLAGAVGAAARRASLLPLNMLRRGSVRPSPMVPRLRLCKAPPHTCTPQGARRTGLDPGYLQVPKWTCKMKKGRLQDESMRRPPVMKR